MPTCGALCSRCWTPPRNPPRVRDIAMPAAWAKRAVARLCVARVGAVYPVAHDHYQRPGGGGLGRRYQLASRIWARAADLRDACHRRRAQIISFTSSNF